MTPACIPLPATGTPQQHRFRRLTGAMMFTLFLVLAGCAGGEPGVGSSGTGVGTSGTQSGSINGFGSVVVEGIRYDDSSATVTAEIDPAFPVDTTSSSLQLGMSTALSFEDDTRATRITIAPNVIGPIETLGTDAAGNLTARVAGQPVRFGASGARSPVFEGFDNASELAAGDWVAVHGTRDADGRVDATRIERLGDADPRVLRVTGEVDAGDGSGFTIGTLRVAIGAATRWLPAAPVAPLAAGQWVTIHVGAAATALAGAGGTVTADTVRIESLPDARRLRLAGRIRMPLAGTARPRVEAATVDLGAAVVEDGTVGDLVPGTFVRVEGLAAGGVLQVERARILREVDEPIGVIGLVSDFVAAGSFRVRQTLVDASAPEVAFDPGSAADLADGVLVEVRGVVRNGVLRATRVRLITTPDERTRALTGAVGLGTGSLLPADGRFSLEGVQARLSASAALRFGDGSPAGRDDVTDGVRVIAQGRFDAGVFAADAMVILRGGEIGRVSTEGLAYQVDPLLRSLRLSRYRVEWSSATPIDGDPSRLRTGARVRVEGRVAGGILIASRLTLRD